MSQQQDYRGGYKRRDVNVDEEKELASKRLNVENKRFFVDVKQNQRGKFIKLVEVGPNRRSRIILSFPAAADLRDRLGEFQKTYSELSPFVENKEAPPASGDKSSVAKTSRNNSSANRYTEDRISSETIIQENRRYYLDLKQNARGRFLRITMSTQTQRAQIVVPAQGMESLKSLLHDLLEEFATPEDLKDHLTEIEPQKLRIDGRMFYFDIGSDRRGTFLRISEVRSTYRTAITIPESHWDKFRDILSEYSEKLAKIQSENREKPKPAAKGDSPADSATEKTEATGENK